MHPPRSCRPAVQGQPCKASGAKEAAVNLQETVIIWATPASFALIALEWLLARRRGRALNADNECLSGWR